MYFSAISALFLPMDASRAIIVLAHAAVYLDKKTVADPNSLCGETVELMQHLLH